MNIPSYVYQNGFGIYYFRIAIPKHLKPVIHKHEIRKSLKTTNYSYALKQARRFAVISERLFLSGIIDVKEIAAAFRTGKEPEHISKSVPESGYTDNIGYPTGQQIQIVKHQSQALPVEKEPANVSLKLKKLIDQYVQCQEVENSWTEKTKIENLAIFATLTEIVGNVHVSDLNHQVVDSFRSKLKCLPPNMNKCSKYRNKTIKQILAANPSETLSDTTVNKYMRRIAAMFNWAVDREHVSKNYFRKKPIQESKKANEKRDMLTSDDLAAIFNPVLFEAEADQPFKYWTPLIALYTGARQNEIAQLDGQDIRQIHGIWCFKFITAKQKKYTERIVPVHSKLQDLGLIEYAKSRPGKLFPELHERRDGYGQAVSKWYNRYRRKCGLNDVGNKDFHSFRHTLSTELFRIGVNLFFDSCRGNFAPMRHVTS